jgi:hypothetical protein
MRTVVVVVMVIAALVHAYFRYWERWWLLAGVVVWQLIVVKEIWGYLFDRDINFIRGPGVRRDASPLARKFACGFYFACYIGMFFVK